VSSNLTASAIFCIVLQCKQKKIRLRCGFFMTHMKVICMKKIALSVATTLIASVFLAACNGSSTNASDVSSGGAAPRDKAVCTSLANWQSVGIGMSATEVQNRLGAPAKILTDATSTEYHYEKCRGFLKLEAEATDDTPATATAAAIPGKPAKYVITNVGGVVVISGARGVTSTTSPIRIDELVVCELDYYTHPYDSIYSVNTKGYAVSTNCRASNNPY
jgi:predicted small secreted protein